MLLYFMVVLSANCTELLLLVLVLVLLLPLLLLPSLLLPLFPPLLLTTVHWAAAGQASAILPIVPSSPSQTRPSQNW